MCIMLLVNSFVFFYCRFMPACHLLSILLMLGPANQSPWQISRYEVVRVSISIDLTIYLSYITQLNISISCLPVDYVIGQFS